LATGKQLQQFQGHTEQIHSLAFSRDGRRIVSGGGWGDLYYEEEIEANLDTCRDCTVRVWNTETAEPLCTYSGHQNKVLCVDWSVDGRLVASGSADSTVRIWRVPH
jgi:WD40 repeat protein